MIIDSSVIGLRVVRKMLKIAGPGVITGAADDDPSGIATYSQTGAQFGYGQLWSMLLMLPMMISIQDACARIGLTKGKGLAGVIKEHYPPVILLSSVCLILVANVINLAADLGAMAAATRLLSPLPNSVLITVFAGISLILQISMDYTTYAGYLKWLCVSLVAYALTAFVVPQNWPEVIKSTFVPHFEYSTGFLMILVGVIGTTISPYLFFWQPSQVVEEARKDGLIPRKKSSLPKWGPLPTIDQRDVSKVRIDTVLGMCFSQIAAWFVLVTAAGSLHTTGKTNIRTAADAARALAPLFKGSPYAGKIAEAVFAIGILGLGFLAIPILAGSAAYAFSDTFGWRNGLAKKPKNAPQFYSVMILSTIAGICIELTGIDPIKALIYSAVINGIVAVPLIYFVLRIGSSAAIMGEFRSGRWIRVLGWLTFGAMALAVITMFTSLIS